jgi:hypothetical protein
MRILRFLNRITGLISLCLCLICASPWPHLNYHLVTLSLYIRSSCFYYTVKNPSWKFRNIFMKARALSSIFLNFSILSYWFLIIHLCIGFGSKLQHTFFTVYERTMLLIDKHIELTRVTLCLLIDHGDGTLAPRPPHTAENWSKTREILFYIKLLCSNYNGASSRQYTI